MLSMLSRYFTIFSKMHNSYLEFGCKVEDLLFKGLTTESCYGMVGLCLSVAVFTFIYETIKTLRQKFVSSFAKSSRDSHFLNESNSERSMLVEIKESQQKWNRFQVARILS
ncbi:copper transporter [Caerostris extrusa]|uniref:Copper transport protein n=1 Tax=Caerostris extrusa TaxID=172846 RepID=A0AAV4RIU3_CAEEX|nr:copper transporter [Caerostris extrusa]